MKNVAFARHACKPWAQGGWCSACPPGCTSPAAKLLGQPARGCSQCCSCEFGRLRAAMRPPAVMQPYRSVTGKQPRFKVLHARLLVPMESWALENTWNVLSRMQKEKGEVKNRALKPLVHWHGMAFPFLFCLGREKRKNTKTFSFPSLADKTRAGHLAGHSRDLSPLGNRMLPSVVRVSTTTTSRAALRTSTWPHPCSPHQVPQTGFCQLTSGVIFPSAQSKDGR